MNRTVGRWIQAGALIFVAMLVVAACEGPAGPGGAKGDTGAGGAKGDTGASGAMGASGAIRARAVLWAQAALWARAAPWARAVWPVRPVRYLSFSTMPLHL